MNRVLPALALAALAACSSGPETPHYYAATQHADPDRVAQLPDSWACDGGTCLDAVSWNPVPQDWEDALAEGALEDATTRDWSACWLSIGPTSYVVCPDGAIETS